MVDLLETTLFNYPVFIGTLYGVELEIEAGGLYEPTPSEDEDDYEPIPARLPHGWEQREEHSICGAEVVFAEPLGFFDSCDAIERVFADVYDQGYRPQRTSRGSTHVHVNVSDLTFDQLRSFVFACAWAEPALIELAGKGRKGNLFALPYQTAPGGWYDIIRILRNPGKPSLYFEQDTHYSAINFQQIVKKGSIEFRMGPSARNAEEAIEWLSHIALVAEAGRTQFVDHKAPPSTFNELMSRVPESVRKRTELQARKQVQELYVSLSAPARKQKTPEPDISPFMATLMADSQVLEDYNAIYGGNITMSPAIQPLVNPVSTEETEF